MDALSSNKELGPLLETVWVPERHLGQGSAAAGVVDDVLQKRWGDLEARLQHWLNLNRGPLQYLHNPLNVSMAFSKVNMPEFSSTFPVLDVGFEHGARTFSLSPDHTSHGELQDTTF